MKKDNLKLIVFCLILFTISRLILMFFSPYVFDPEEHKTGSLGHDVVFRKDLIMPLFGYLDSPHAGGSLLAQIEVIPFYILFGDRHIAIKMAAILNSMIVFLIGLYFMNKYFSNLELVLFSLFYILGTPYFLQHNITIQGNDFLFIIFLMFSLWLVLALLVEKKRPIKHYAFLGFVLAFGFWIQYSMALMIISTLILILIEKKISLNQLVVFGIFFFIGLSPWFIYNISYNWPSIFSDKRVHIGDWDIWINQMPERFFNFFTLHLPRSFHFLDLAFIPAWIFDYLFYIIIISLIIISLKFRNKLKMKSKSFSLIILFYLVTLILLFNFFNVPVGNGLSKFNSMSIQHEIYLLMFHPFLIILCAISSGILLRYSKKVGVFLLVITILLMVIGNYITLTPPKFNNYLLLPAHSSEMLAFEAGSYYILYPPTFHKFYYEIKNNSLLKENYLKGAGVGILYFLQIKDPNREEIEKIIENNIQQLNKDEKKTLFIAFIKGDEILDSPPENIVKANISSIDKFRYCLSEEDKKLFDAVFMQNRLNLSILR